MSEELKPCPFCGGKAVIEVIEPHRHIICKMPVYKGGAFIECTECGCAISGETETEATEKWNRRYYYYEDWQRNDIADVTKWKPSIHMPKEAARIWLKVTGVRMERLQEITEVGIQKEGVEVDPKECAGKFDFISELFLLFQRLWNSTIKKSDIDRYGWDANPWVWVIEFERCEKQEEI